MCGLQGCYKSMYANELVVVTKPAAWLRKVQTLWDVIVPWSPYHNQRPATHPMNSKRSSKTRL